ncbi:hypothetical protein HK405_015096, partial [Cladochytrium tenue]
MDGGADPAHEGGIGSGDVDADGVPTSKPLGDTLPLDSTSFAAADDGGCGSDAHAAAALPDRPVDGSSTADAIVADCRLRSGDAVAAAWHAPSPVDPLLAFPTQVPPPPLPPFPIPASAQFPPSPAPPLPILFLPPTPDAPPAHTAGTDIGLSTNGAATLESIRCDPPVVITGPAPSFPITTISFTTHHLSTPVPPPPQLSRRSLTTSAISSLVRSASEASPLLSQPFHASHVTAAALSSSSASASSSSLSASSLPMSPDETYPLVLEPSRLQLDQVISSTPTEPLFAASVDATAATASSAQSQEMPTVNIQGQQLVPLEFQLQPPTSPTQSHSQL